MTVPLIPREVLFGNPERMGPRLSPDGERLAFLAPKDGVLNVWVGPVGAPLEDFEPVTDDRKRGIRVCFWAEATYTSSTSRMRAATRTGAYTPSTRPRARTAI